MAEFRKLHQFNAFCVYTPTQVALAEHLKKEYAYTSLAGIMQQKRDLFLNEMKDSGFSMLRSNGSYFVCATYENISSLPEMEFCLRMIKDFGVATIPVSAFYLDGNDDHVIRFCFSKKDETITQAAKKLSAIKQLS